MSQIDSFDENDESVIPNSQSKFRQQRVPACRPFLTPCSAAIVYGVFAAVCLTVGLVYLYASNDLHEIRIPYEDCTINEEKKCKVPVVIDHQLKGPVFIYYELTKVYQNNFMYGSSKNWDQLKGDFVTKNDSLESCKPKTFAEDKAILVPCGSVANSAFQDNFAFPPQIQISTENIALGPFKKLFEPENEKYVAEGGKLWLKDTQFKTQTDERFINWMQLAPFATFRKLWGKTGTIEPQKFEIEVTNDFDVSKFGGKKAIILAQVAWIGGKNQFFGIFFLVMCGISSLAALVFVVLYFFNILPLYKALANAGGSLESSLLPNA